MIKCKINGVNYKLKVLVTDDDKQKGLKVYPVLSSSCGVIFIYNKDIDTKFDFSEIGYQCMISFLDSNCNVIYYETTSSYQKDLVVCPRPYRYVIEIGKDWDARDDIKSHL